MNLIKSSKRIYLIVLLIILLFSLSSFLFFQEAAFAQLTELKNVAENAGLGTETAPSKIIAQVIKTLLSLFSLIAIVIIIVAGFQWMTSGGSEDKIKAAKKLMSSALVGLIIIIFAYAISYFVIQKLSEVTTPPVEISE